MNFESYKKILLNPFFQLGLTAVFAAFGFLVSLIVLSSWVCKLVGNCF